MRVKPMTNGSSDPTKGYQAPSAIKKTGKQRGFSPIWIIPIVALVIGLFLIYKLVTETGPTITITFKEGSGLEAGKTKVKFKDIEIGQVTAVDLIPDLSGVTATVSMDANAKPYMNDKTRFWVVRPRIGVGGISGLGTLLSGAYIGTDPAIKGKAQKKFIGLERPPVVQFDDPGRQYKLHSPKLGGLDAGSPVFYKQVRAGQVVDYKMDDNGQITFDIFIHEKFEKRINSTTRFWNAGGIDIVVSAEGVEVNTESLASILAGGVGFDDRPGRDAAGSVDEGHEFHLYPSENASKQRHYARKRQLLMYFDDPIRGLSPGAPVELRGYKIGEVTDITFEMNRETGDVRIPVLVEIEPGRVNISGGEKTDTETSINTLVAKGLRAQLKSANIVLGKLLIDLDFHPDEPEAFADFSGPIPVIPTIRSALGGIVNDARVLIAGLRETGETINTMLASSEFKSSAADLSATIASLKGISAQLDENTAPQITAVLSEVEQTLDEARVMFESNSTTRTEINRLLVELAQAARSIRLMADYLEQHPESIIKGKD
jgi:paraquat-inducible protein B